MAAMRASGALGVEQPLIILQNASGMLVADPARCVSCQRCELACTEFNNGKADPKLARIKVGRNMFYGPDGAGNGGREHRGFANDGLAIQDVCRQCKHPVPCATACPQNAIIAQPGSGTRIVDESRCVGCRICQRACPWNMMTFDEDKGTASKCFLCNGHPKCVEACPAQAIQYVPWSDRSRVDPTRGASIWSVPANKYAACVSCHVDSPGGPRGAGPRR
jgi:Fe-S-cluster-containing dehydrogenase component